MANRAPSIFALLLLLCSLVYGRINPILAKRAPQQLNARTYEGGYALQELTCPANTTTCPSAPGALVVRKVKRAIYIKMTLERHIAVRLVSLSAQSSLAKHPSIDTR